MKLKHLLQYVGKCTEKERQAPITVLNHKTGQEMEIDVVEVNYNSKPEIERVVFIINKKPAGKK